VRAAHKGQLKAALIPKAYLVPLGLGAGVKSRHSEGRRSVLSVDNAGLPVSLRPEVVGSLSYVSRSGALFAVIVIAVVLGVLQTIRNSLNLSLSGGLAGSHPF